VTAAISGAEAMFVRVISATAGNERPVVIDNAAIAQPNTAISGL